MKIRFALALYVGLFVMHTTGVANASDLNGVPIGASRSTVAARFPEQKCRPERKKMVECVVVGQTYAGQRPKQLSVAYLDDKLAGYQLHFQGKHVDALFESIAGKLGQPNAARSIEQSTHWYRRVAQPWESQVHRWKTPDGTEVVIVFVGTKDKTSEAPTYTTLSVSSAAYDAWLAQLMKPGS